MDNQAEGGNSVTLWNITAFLAATEFTRVDVLALQIGITLKDDCMEAVPKQGCFKNSLTGNGNEILVPFLLSGEEWSLLRVIGLDSRSDPSQSDLVSFSDVFRERIFSGGVMDTESENVAIKGSYTTSEVAPFPPTFQHHSLKIWYRVGESSHGLQ